MKTISMEIEDFVIATFLIGIIGSAFVYSYTNPLPFSDTLIESAVTGAVCVYAAMSL